MSELGSVDDVDIGTTRLLQEEFIEHETRNGGNELPRQTTLIDESEEENTDMHEEEKDCFADLKKQTEETESEDNCKDDFTTENIRESDKETCSKDIADTSMNGFVPQQAINSEEVVQSCVCALAEVNCDRVSEEEVDNVFDSPNEERKEYTKDFPILDDVKKED